MFRFTALHVSSTVTVTFSVNGYECANFMNE